MYSGNINNNKLVWGSYEYAMIYSMTSTNSTNTVTKKDI